MFAEAFPFPVLLGDIGGTNARFALIAAPDQPVQRFPNVHTSDYALFSEAMLAASGGATVAPKSAVVALAGPVTGDRIELTNAPWVVEPKLAIQRLGLEMMAVLNDFEAQSLALPILSEDDLAPIGHASPQTATKVVVGPGTGLGAGAIVYSGGAWLPIPGEGGHIDLGPTTPRDNAIWPHIEQPFGRVSAETLISGGGMVRLYRAICAADAVTPRWATPAEITEHGLAKADPHATETLSLFSTYLGRVAGDLALVFLARGGVYLAGGISTRITSVLQEGPFRAAFEDKEPHEDILADVATVVVATRDAALAGLGAFVRKPSSFRVDLDGRAWRA